MSEDEEDDMPTAVLNDIMKEVAADIQKPVAEGEEKVSKQALEPSTEQATVENIVKALTNARMETLRDIAAYNEVKGSRTKVSIVEVIAGFFVTELLINTSTTKPLLSKLLTDLGVSFRKADRKEMWIRALHTFLLNPAVKDK